MSHYLNRKEENHLKTSENYKLYGTFRHEGSNINKIFSSITRIASYKNYNTYDILEVTEKEFVEHSYNKDSISGIRVKISHNGELLYVDENIDLLKLKEFLSFELDYAIVF